MQVGKSPTLENNELVTQRIEHCMDRYPTCRPKIRNTNEQRGVFISFVIL